MPRLLNVDILQREQVRVLALGLAYFAVAAFTITFTRFEGGVACVWAATAVLLAALLRTPGSAWLPRLAACWIASVAATTLFGLGPAVAVPLGFINIAEAAGAAWLLRRLGSNSLELRSIREVLSFLLAGGVLAPALTGLGGAVCATAVSPTSFGENWMNWFAGHALGTIVLAPLLLLTSGGAAAQIAREAGRRGVLEAVALLSLVAATTAVVFAQTRMPLLFLPFLPMMAAVFRLGRLGAVTSSAIVAVIGVYGTLKGMGPVALFEAEDGARAQFLQFYLAVAVMTVLPAAAELKRRKILFAELQQTSALQQLILDRTSDIIMRLEVDGTVAYVSPSIGRVGGYTPGQLLGRTPHHLILPADVPRVVQAHRRALACPSETFITEYRAQRDDGSVAWLEAHTRATVDEDGRSTGAVSIIREVTRRKEEAAELERRAHTDPLTGLANRRAFEAAFSRAVEHACMPAAPGCVAIFDLDRFKAVNDRYGHALGDEVLKRFAEVAQATVRGSDVVARFGGEEFVVLLSGAARDEAGIVVERVRRRFADLDIRDDAGQPVRVTVSAGLACLHPDWSVEQVLKAADEALYRSKASGRNRLTIAA